MRVIASIVVAVATLLAGAPAPAQTAELCLSRQLGNAGRACLGMGRCTVTAMRRGTDLDAACIDRRKARLVFLTEDDELHGGCIMPGVSAETGDMLEAGNAALGASLGLDGGRCAATKMAALGKYCRGIFRCAALAGKADTMATGFDPDCVARYDARLGPSFAKAEARGDCATTGDDADRGADVVQLATSAFLFLSGQTTTTTMP